MHVTKNDLPVKIDAPGAHARHAELVMFSPQAEHALVLDHILAKMAPA